MTVPEMTSLLAASLLVAGVLLARPGRAELGVRSAVAPRAVDAQDRGLLLRLRPLLSVLGFVAGWAFLGGPVGLVAGAVAAVFSWRVLAGIEGPRARARRTELEEDLPIAVHLLGACLRAGAAPSTATRAVAEALPGAVAEELGAIAARLDLGADPVAVWREVAESGPLAPLGRALARAHETGASVTEAIAWLSEDLRAGTRGRTAARARTIEVRASAPLGVCFLPAFLLLGVVPMTVGIFASMRLFG
jgi:Flp pilus assembly protein TadB